jgi:hypothetical protein
MRTGGATGLFFADAAGFLADAVFALARLEALADVLAVVAAFAVPRLALAPLPDLRAVDAVDAFAATRLAVLVFAPPAFKVDLEDFLRVFLDIRLPFVAFSGVFWDSQEPRPDH